MKLSSYIYSLLLLMCGLATQAQDVITFNNGDEVKATITEVNDLKIKYKLFNSSDTTIQTAKTSSIFMIKYANGTKQVFGNTLPAYSKEIDKLADAEIAKLKAQTDYARYSKIYKYKKTVAIVLTSIGAPVLAVGIPVCVVGAVNERRESKAYGYVSQRSNNMYNIGGLMTVSGFALTLTGSIHFGLATKYKKKRDAAASQLSLYPTTQSIQPVGNIGSSYSGIAMRINF